MQEADEQATFLDGIKEGLQKTHGPSPLVLVFKLGGLKVEVPRVVLGWVIALYIVGHMLGGR